MEVVPRAFINIKEANIKFNAARDKAQLEAHKATAAAEDRAAAQDELSNARNKLAETETKLATQEAEHQQAMAKQAGVANGQVSLEKLALESQLVSVKQRIALLTQDEKAN